MAAKKDTVISARDAALTTTEAGLSLINGGGILSALLNQFIPKTWQKRTNEEMECLRNEFQRLDQKIDKNKISSENFHITVLQVIMGALIENHAEKRAAFRAILLNEAISPAPNPELDLFIKITRDLTLEHIQALKVLNDPVSAQSQHLEISAKINAITSTNSETIPQSDIISVLLKPSLPEIPEDHFLLILHGLTSLGLLVDPGMAWGGVTAWKSSLNPQKILEKRITPLGERYIQFITLP